MSERTILVIDDDEDLLNYIQQIISPEQFEVKTASSASEGLKLLEEAHPDLILLDIKMPDVDGWQMNKKLKEDEETANIPVAFLTAKEDLSDKLTALKEGAVDYIMKPINKKDIITRINNILNK